MKQTNKRTSFKAIPQKKCHICRGKGKTDGGALQKNIPVKRVGVCLYCKGKGYRLKHYGQDFR